MLPQSWLRVWRKGGWIRLLSGTTLPPSMADAGVESWILCLRDSRASRGALPGSARESRMSGGSGPTSPASSESAGQPSYSLRMSRGSLPLDCGTSSKALPRWGSMRSGTVSERQTLVRRIGGRESLSWPTANTPSGGPNTKTMWQTPAKDQFEKRRQVRQTTREELLLPGQAKAWPTANAHDGRRPGHEQDSTQGANLKREAETRQTPSANEDAACRPEAKMQQMLKQQAESFHSGPQILRETGAESPQPSGLRLNPAFVEWLMGLPHGWTDFAPVAMESFRLWRRTHTELLRSL